MKDVPPEFGFGNELFSAKSEPFWHYDGQSIVEIRTCALKCPGWGSNSWNFSIGDGSGVHNPSRKGGMQLGNWKDPFCNCIKLVDILDLESWISWSCSGSCRGSCPMVIHYYSLPYQDSWRKKRFFWISIYSRHSDAEFMKEFLFPIMDTSC
jgi:hypothetical protein